VQNSFSLALSRSHTSRMRSHNLMLKNLIVSRLFPVFCVSLIVPFSLDSVDDVLTMLERRFDKERQTKFERAKTEREKDFSVHCCLYIIPPSGYDSLAFFSFVLHSFSPCRFLVLSSLLSSSFPLLSSSFLLL